MGRCLFKEQFLTPLHLRPNFDKDFLQEQVHRLNSSVFHYLSVFDTRRVAARLEPVPFGSGEGREQIGHVTIS